MLPDPPLIVITDRRACRRELLEVVDASFGAGCRWIMVRDKDLSSWARLRLAAGIATLSRNYGASCIVNDSLALATECGAHGVHLPACADLAQAREGLGPDALLGVSTHDIGEAESARTGGADYITLSPIFASTSKPGYGPPLGLDMLSRCVEAVDVPVLALGGVDESNARECMDAGAAGVAVVGAVMASSDPAAACRRLLSAIAR